MAAKPPLYSEEQVRVFGAVYWSPERPDLEEVARRAHCARSTLTRYFKRYGIPLRKVGSGRPRSGVLSPDDLAHMDFLHSLGMTQREIGAELHVAASTVSDNLRKRGIPTRQRRDYTKANGYYVTLSDEERERRSRNLRQRWAEGRMDHVASLRRRRAATPA